MTDTALAVRESTAMAQFGTADDLKLLANRIGILFGIGQGKQGAALDAEMEKARRLIRGGRFIPGPDHFALSDTPYENYKYFMDRMREVILTTKPG